MRTILASLAFIVCCIAVPVLSFSTAYSAPLSKGSTLGDGDVEAFCPAFIHWSLYPDPERCDAGAPVHGLGVIPAPVTLVQCSRNTVESSHKPGFLPDQRPAYSLPRNQRLISVHTGSA